MILIQILDQLDDLVVKNTSGLTTSSLRNQIHRLREHIEALYDERARWKNDYNVLKNQTEQKISELEAAVRRLAEENSRVTLEVSQLRGTAPMTESKLLPETEMVLKHFFDTSDPHNAAGIAFFFDEISLNKALYHVAVLREREMLSAYNSSNTEHQIKYTITQKGRAYVVEQMPLA